MQATATTARRAGGISSLDGIWPKSWSRPTRLPSLGVAPKRWNFRPLFQFFFGSKPICFHIDQDRGKRFWEFFTANNAHMMIQRQTTAAGIRTKSAPTASARPELRRTCRTAGGSKSRSRWPATSPPAPQAYMTDATTPWHLMRSSGWSIDVCRSINTSI